MRPSTMASRRRVCVVPRDSHEPRYPGAAVVVHVVGLLPASTPRVNEPSAELVAPREATRKPRLPRVQVTGPFFLIVDEERSRGGL